jgi:hypothetical protein
LSTVSITQRPFLRSEVGERFFFLSITLLISAAVFYGFGSEYVQFRAEYFPFPSLLVYIHAALLFAWMLLLLIQASLVSLGRVAWHRYLGMGGFFLLCCIPIISALTVSAAVVHNRFPSGFDGPMVFYYDSVASLIAFAGLAYFALRYRNAPQTHKRLILLATLVVGEAGIVRWPVRWVHEVSHGVTMVTYLFLFLIVLYDFSSRRKIHPATLWGGLFLVVYEETQNLIGHSRVWHSVASWILHFWPK